MNSNTHEEPDVQVEETNGPDANDLYDLYKESEEYKGYFENIKQENPNLSDYLINIAIFGFWYNLTHGKEFEVTTEPQLKKEAPKGDIPDMVNSYNSFDEYLSLNPEVKVIGNDIKIIQD